MGGIIDRLTGDRPRPETLREGNLRETPLESFQRRTGRDVESIKAQKQLEPAQEPSLEAQFRERRRQLLNVDAGPDAGSGPGGIAGTINKLGSNLLGGPSVFGVPINPLKLITNGFHASQKYAAEPLAGYIIGSFGITAAFVPGMRNSRLAEQGRDFYQDVIFGDGSFWSDSRDFQKNRENLFWGEKFISVMATDPLNFVGFGLLGKIPVVGRTALKWKYFGQSMEFSLGGIERGYIGATNMPFKMTGKLFKRFPSAGMRLVNTVPGVNFGKILDRSRNQIIADAGARAADIVRRSYSRAAGDGTQGIMAHSAVTKEQILRFAAEAMEMSTPYGQLPSREHKQFRDLMLEANPISRAGIQKIVKVVGSTERVTRHQRFAVNNVIELAIRGRASTEEVAEQIIKIVGGEGSLSKNVTQLEGLIADISTDRFARLERQIAEISVPGLERHLVRKALGVKRKQLQSRFEEWTEDMGRMGALVRGLDRAQTRVWQNMIQRYLARPLATSILKTPEFLISNIPEDAVRAITGRSSLVYRGVDDMSIDFAGYSVYSRGLFQQQSPTANRIAGLSQFDEYATRRDIGLSDAIPNFKGKQAVVNAGRLLGDVWFETANQIASNARRGYFTERSYKRLAEVYQNEVFTRGLADALGALPDALANSDYGSIVRTATIRAGRGEGDAIRTLKTELTKEKVDLKNAIKVIDTMATNGDLSAETRSLWHDWAQKGGDLNLLDDLAKQTEEIQFQQFMDSGERAGIHLQALLASIKNVDLTNDAERITALRNLDEAMSDLMDIPHRMERGVTRRIRRGELGRAAKFDLETRQALFEQVEEGQEELFNIIDEKMPEIVQAAIDLNKGNPIWANLHRRMFTITSEARVLRNRRVQNLMSSTDDRSSYFYEVELDEVINDAWEAAEHGVDELNTLRDQAWEELGAQTGNRTRSSIEVTLPKNIFDKNKPFGEKELADILGGDPGQVQQAIIGDKAMSKTRFVDRVIKQASEVGANIPPFARDRIGKVYDEVLATLGIDDQIHSAFSAREEILESLKQQLIENKVASKFTPGLKRELDDYLERVAAQLDNMSPTAKQSLREVSDGAVAEATEDLKAAFVNYDDQTMMDAFFTSIFPFWTYESRRIPFLARTGVQNPLMWKSFGPQGHYWENTDNGYVRADVLGMGMEFNLIGGTAFNAPRRMFRAEFPTQHDGGMLGQYSSVEESIARFGFYPGPHVKILTEGILPALSSGAETERGEFFPTSYANVINLAGSAGQLPGLDLALAPISDEINRVKDLVFNDRFRERQVLKELWDMGLPADQIDITTMRPRPGSIVTQEDIRQAMRQSSVKEALTGLVGKVRFRSNDEVELRDAVAGIYEKAGLPRDLQDKALKAGVPRSSLVALSPNQQEVLNNLPGADEYRAINSVLRSPRAKEIAELTSRMWEAYHAQVEAIDEEQRKLDMKWLSGQIAPSDYRDLTSQWKTRRSQTLPTLRGRLRKRNSRGELKDTPLDIIEVTDPSSGRVTRTRGAEAATFYEVPVTAVEHLKLAQELGRDDFQPLRHEVDELLEEYRSYVPTDMDGDGRPEWNTFFQQRALFIELLPPAVEEEFMAQLHKEEELAPGIPSPQGVLRSLGEGKLGEYWAIDDRIQEELGVFTIVEFVCTRASTPD